MRDLFVGWAREAGCTVEIDPVGNIFARRPGTDDSLPAGRHRQPSRHADLRRTLRRRARRHVRPGGDPDAQRPRYPNAPADRADHVDQRGRRPLQSAVDGFAGVRRQAAGRAGARHARTTPACAFGDELERIGYAGKAPLGNRPLDCYLELHIEQAPHLDREGCDIGIVVGGYKTLALRIDIQGETSHSGGTPMAERRNALVGAGYLIAAVNDIGLAFAAEQGRTTTPRIECFPNLPGIIPEQVRLIVDFRHPDPGRLRAHARARSRRRSRRWKQRRGSASR